MTRKTRAEERIDELDTSPAALTAQLEALTAERDEALAKADEYVGLLQRERAEFTNFKRRTAEERQRDLGLAGVDLIAKVLNLADDFDRAIETRPVELDGNAWAEGIAAIDRKLRLLLESEGVTQVDAAPGTPFDPARPRGRRDHPRRPGTPRARSWTRSGAATGSATASSAPRWSRSRVATTLRPSRRQHP